MNSVFSQSSDCFEYIVIDGGSTDGSREFISQNQNKLTYWVSEPDNGIYHAMNKGIVKSKGDYLLFLNSGDLLYDSTSLNTAISNLHDEDLVCFDLIFRGLEDIQSNYPTHINLSYFWNSTIGHPSTFIRRKLFDKVKYDESLKIVSDWKFFILVLFKFNATYKKVNQVLSIFFNDGISSNPQYSNLIITERENVLNQEFKYMQDEMTELNLIRSTLNLLKSSRKIRLLQYLKIIRRF